MATTTNGGIAAGLAPADGAARQQALERLEGHLQLVACAGAGKTETVARRIVEILSLPGVGAEHVAAFTFTERAAAELKDRIARRYADANGASNGLADLYVGTIHAFCLRLLQQYHLDVLSFQVLTDVQQRLLISRNSRKCGLAELRTKNGKPWNRYRQAGTFAETMAILREAEIDPAALAGSEIEAILHQYEDVLEHHRYFDYTSILSRTADLLETDQKFCDRVVDTLRFVTVDEYQDVNPIQERLLIALAERGVNICVVGDDDQLLYNWRGSRMVNMIDFSKRYSTVLQLTLDENFRSSRGVVDLAAEIIQHNDPTRLPKRMHAAGAQRYEEGDITMTAFDSATAEAEFIASEVRRLLGTPFVAKTGSATAPRGLSHSDPDIATGSSDGHFATLMPAGRLSCQGSTS